MNSNDALYFNIRPISIKYTWLLFPYAQLTLSRSKSTTIKTKEDVMKYVHS